MDFLNKTVKKTTFLARGMLAAHTSQAFNRTINPVIYVPTCNLLNAKTTTTASAVGAAMGPHALMFKIERYWAAAMIPLLPVAYFIHTPAMDFTLSFAIVMHTHWGAMAVVQDYARPIVIGETLAKVAPWTIYIMTLILMAGMYQFNTNDVGLTKAFEKFFSL